MQHSCWRLSQGNFQGEREEAEGKEGNEAGMKRESTGRIISEYKRSEYRVCVCGIKGEAMHK